MSTWSPPTTTCTWSTRRRKTTWQGCRRSRRRSGWSRAIGHRTCWRSTWCPEHSLVVVLAGRRLRESTAGEWIGGFAERSVVGTHIAAIDGYAEREKALAVVVAQLHERARVRGVFPLIIGVSHARVALLAELGTETGPALGSGHAARAVVVGASFRFRGGRRRRRAGRATGGGCRARRRWHV